MKTRKKKFDAVEFMREARRRIQDQWADKPRSEEIDYLRRKYARPPTRRKAES